ncbi:MAG: pyridoxal phosphate-dependent decarboxylase family protein, partial [Alphaproteobacteria bacterium]
MDRDDYRKWAHKAVDWSANYLETVRQRPVRAQTAPGDILVQLAKSPPEKGDAMEAIFADFENQVMPGMTHWQHPRFFAYFPANSSPPSLIAEQLTATLAAQCMLWQTSPAATELETVVIDWLRQMIGLPQDFSGCIQDSASTATLCAILTARERALNWRGNAEGLSGHPAIRIYCSDQVHSSIDKAMWVAGLGQDNLVKLPTDAAGAMDTDRLKAAIAADRKAGALPAGIVACIGSTSVGASDNIAAIVPIARSENLYL